MIVGMTGRGKSNVGIHLALQLLHQNKNWIAIDWKRSWRSIFSLKKQVPRVQEIQIFTVGRDASPFRWNPLRPPPGLHPKVWIGCISEILEKSHLSGPGVADFLLKALDELLEDSPDGKPTVEPIFFDLLKKLESFRGSGREGLWIQSAKRVVRAFTREPLGKSFNDREGIKLEELFSRPTIIELDFGLPQPVRQFVSEVILRFLHLWRLSKGESSKLTNVIFLEELHNLIPNDWRYKGTGLDSLFREIRSFGVGLVGLTQNPSKIGAPLLGNCQVQIVMALQHSEDIKSSAAALFLDRQDEWVLDRLKVGYGVVKVKGRCQPALIRFPLIPVHKGSVSDEDIGGHMRRLFTLFPKEQLQGRLLPQKRPSDIYKHSLGKQLLLDILKFPLCGVRVRYRNLSWNPKQGNSAKESLLQEGMIKSLDISTKKGRVKLFDLTVKGKVLLRELGHEVPDEIESIEHRFWKKRLVRYYEEKKGFQTEVEAVINGRPDIMVSTGREILAVEIETGKSDILKNAEKNLPKNFDQIIFVPTTPKAEKKVKKVLGANGLLKHPKIRILPAQSYP